MLPGSLQVLSRVGAGWPAEGGLVMNHVVPPAAHSPDRGQGADSRGRAQCFQPSLACRGGCRTRVQVAPSFPVPPHTHREPWVLAPELTGWNAWPAFWGGSQGCDVPSDWGAEGTRGARVLGWLPPPVWFDFLEQWRVTGCSSPTSPAGW